jgi:hypothetical protein
MILCFLDTINREVGEIRGRLVADPPGDLGNGGRFETTGGGAILEAGVPPRWEAWAGSEVAGVGLKEDGRGPTDNGAETEVELPPSKAGEGRELVARRVGERLSIGGDVLEARRGRGGQGNGRGC